MYEKLRNLCRWLMKWSEMKWTGMQHALRRGSFERPEGKKPLGDVTLDSHKFRNLKISHH